MQTNKTLSLAGCFIFLLHTYCSPEDDIKNPNFSPLIFSEDFSKGAVDDTVLDLDNWTNIAEVGTVKWKTQIFSGNPYAEFNAFLSGDALNIGWLISPSIDLDDTDRGVLQFQAAQNRITSSANALEVLIATDYNGSNLATANWQPLNAILPTTSSRFFQFVNSGEIDLSSFSGNFNIAFKVTNPKLNGAYQLDTIRIYTKN